MGKREKDNEEERKNLSFTNSFFNNSANTLISLIS